MATKPLPATTSLAEARETCTELLTAARLLADDPTSWRQMAVVCDTLVLIIDEQRKHRECLEQLVAAVKQLQSKK